MVIHASLVEITLFSKYPSKTEQHEDENNGHVSVKGFDRKNGSVQSCSERSRHIGWIDIDESYHRMRLLFASDRANILVHVKAVF